MPSEDNHIIAIMVRITGMDALDIFGERPVEWQQNMREKRTPRAKEVGEKKRTPGRSQIVRASPAMFWGKACSHRGGGFQRPRRILS